MSMNPTNPVDIEDMILLYEDNAIVNHAFYGQISHKLDILAYYVTYKFFKKFCRYAGSFSIPSALKQKKYKLKLNGFESFKHESFEENHQVDSKLRRKLMR